MTERDGAVLLVFVPAASARDLPLDYGRRFQRLRWRRALEAGPVRNPDPGAPAGSILRGHRRAVIVRDDGAMLLPLPEGFRPPTGRLTPVEPLGAADLPPVHTLRELELASRSSAIAAAAPHAGRSRVPAVAVDVESLPPGDGESIGDYARRLFEEAGSAAFDSGFRALVLDDPSEHERVELLGLFPPETARACDVGCGAGAAGRALRRLRPRARVTGIESDPRAAALARERLDRVLEEDAAAALERLGREGESFDAFLFADVLEHLPDPIAVLALARRIASPGAVLVASVPNVGHLSLVRDLLLGRFDPLPAGLTDAGHLRWFDRRFLAEALEEAGWRVRGIESLAGAPAPDSESFLDRFADWPGLDRGSLGTYQWVAVAGVEECEAPGAR